MSRTVAVAVGIGAGCLVGMQAPVNARLGKAVGSVQAATFSFLVGTALLLAIAAFVKAGWVSWATSAGLPGGRSWAACWAPST